MKLLNYKCTLIAIIVITILITRMMSSVGEIPTVRTEPYSYYDCIGVSFLLFMVMYNGFVSGYEMRKNEEQE
jgi:uncharacterized membrane protein YdfJ with MMPL/SSD domain